MPSNKTVSKSGKSDKSDKSDKSGESGKSGKSGESGKSGISGISGKSYSNNQRLLHKQKTQIDYLKDQRINIENKNILIFGILMKKLPQDIIEKISKLINPKRVLPYYLYKQEDKKYIKKG